MSTFRERFAAKHGKWPEAGDRVDNFATVVQLVEHVADEIDAIAKRVLPEDMESPAWGEEMSRNIAALDERLDGSE